MYKSLIIVALLVSNCSTRKAVKNKNQEDDKNNVAFVKEQNLQNELVTHFKFDSSAVQNKHVLEENISKFDPLAVQKIQIDGYCDARGSEQYNLKLGQRRADSVHKIFNSFIQFKDTNIQTNSFGKSKASKCKNEACYKKDRKVIISITNK